MAPKARTTTPHTKRQAAATPTAAERRTIELASEVTLRAGILKACADEVARLQLDLKAARERSDAAEHLHRNAQAALDEHLTGGQS